MATSTSTDAEPIESAHSRQLIVFARRPAIPDRHISII